MTNRLTQLLDIQYPIIQAGMVWVSGWKLAAAVSQAGGLGTIGAGSMTPELLSEHIHKFKAVSSRPFAVNVPLLHGSVSSQMEVICNEHVPVVITSAGNPKTWTKHLHDHGIRVIHVISSTHFAHKAEDAGVDAIIAEGFEAGGHNGREETTTLCLVPAVCTHIQIPVIAAGGIASGRAMLAAFALGASGVQVGTRFVTSHESSAHPLFKQAILNSKEGDTHLQFKQLTPVRLLENAFSRIVAQEEQRGTPAEQLKKLLGSGRSKLGMFDGDMEHGELEIGQISFSIQKIQPAAEIVSEIWEEYQLALQSICSQSHSAPHLNDTP